MAVVARTGGAGLGFCKAGIATRHVLCWFRLLRTSSGCGFRETTWKVGIGE